MVNKLNYLKKLEEGIEWVGEKWKNNGDRMFWWEADVQARLLCHLWETIAEPVPLVHAEIPVRKKENIRGTRHYDLALYEPDVVKPILKVDWPYSNYGQLLAKREALAAIEIKLMGCSLGRDEYPKPTQSKLDEIQSDIRKLTLGKNMAQIEHAYLLVFCEANSISSSGKQRKPCPLETLQAFQGKIKSQVTGLNHKINVYWASNHPDDTPRWL